MAFRAKHKIYIYYLSKQNGVEQSKKLAVIPSSIQMEYLDEMGNKDTHKQVFYENKLYSKDVKNKKGKVVHKKGTVEKKNVKRTYNLTGTSTKEYLKGYYTRITIHFNCLTEPELRSILTATRQKYQQLLTFKSTYKDVNGNKQTDSYQNTYTMDKIGLGFYEPVCKCFCRTMFSMEDISFTTSYKNPNTHDFVYEDVSFTFKSTTARMPRSKWKGLTNGMYKWQDSLTGKWTKDVKPTHTDGYV